MLFTEAENAHYRALAGYETEARPMFLKLQAVNVQFLRGLILKRWQQVNAECICGFFRRQQAPEYLSCRHLLTKFNPNPRGGYPSHLIYLPHQFLPVIDCPYYTLFLVRWHRTAGTFEPLKPAEQLLADRETHFRYNNLIIRPSANRDLSSGQPVWGRTEVASAWQHRTPDARAFIAGQLKATAHALTAFEALTILTEPGAPRLAEMRHGDVLLGCVAYFFDCWRKFHENERPAPVATASAQLSLRQVALLYTYENKVIPKAADEVARQYGHQSGAKLYERYLTVSQRAGRVGDDITGQKLVPMIKDITRVVARLSGSARQQAESELQTLEARK